MINLLLTIHSYNRNLNHAILPIGNLILKLENCFSDVKSWMCEHRLTLDIHRYLLPG